jgi:hypothetical protein
MTITKQKVQVIIQFTASQIIFLDGIKSLNKPFPILLMRPATVGSRTTLTGTSRAVLKAVKDGLIPEERLASYHRLTEKLIFQSKKAEIGLKRL